MRLSCSVAHLKSFGLVTVFTSSCLRLFGVLSDSPTELEAQVDGTGRYERGPREPRTITANLPWLGGALALLWLGGGFVLLEDLAATVGG